MGNTINVQGSYIDIHDNEVVNLTVDKAQVRLGDNGEQAEEEADVDMLVACVQEVRDHFWGDSSMAVIFCVCRDSYGYADNMSQFERDFHCQAGVLSNAFRNNPYMRLNISKWEQNGAKKRALQLRDAYTNAVLGRLKS